MVDISIDNNLVLCWVVESGYLNVVKCLVSQSADIYARGDLASSIL